MNDSQTPEKAHDIDKNDPNYQIKVSEVLRRRFEEEKKKSFDREKNKMDEGRKKTSNSSSIENENLPPTTSPPPSSDTQPQRDPEEYVKRKDIVALVNNINNSFAIIEKHRVKVEEFMLTLKEFFHK